MKIRLRAAVQGIRRPDVDVAKLVVMALQAVDSHAEKRPRGSAGEAHRIGLIGRRLIGSRRNKVGRGPTGPYSLVGQQLAYKLVVRPVGRELIREPQCKSSATKEDE